MIEERYCSFEVEKLLKKNGFNNDYAKGDCYQQTCTHQMALDWLRENYSFHIYLTFSSLSDTWVLHIQNLKSGYEYSKDTHLRNYKTSVDEALKWVFKDFI